MVKMSTAHLNERETKYFPKLFSYFFPLYFLLLMDKILHAVSVYTCFLTHLLTHKSDVGSWQSLVCITVGYEGDIKGRMLQVYACVYSMFNHRKQGHGTHAVSPPVTFSSFPSVSLSCSAPTHFFDLVLSPLASLVSLPFSTALTPAC